MEMQIYKGTSNVGVAPGSSGGPASLKFQSLNRESAEQARRRNPLERASVLTLSSLHICLVRNPKIGKIVASEIAAFLSPISFVRLCFYVCFSFFFARKKIAILIRFNCKGESHCRRCRRSTQLPVACLRLYFRSC